MLRYNYRREIITDCYNVLDVLNGINIYCIQCDADLNDAEKVIFNKAVRKVIFRLGDCFSPDNSVRKLQRLANNPISITDIDNILGRLDRIYDANDLSQAADIMTTRYANHCSTINRFNILGAEINYIGVMELADLLNELHTFLLNYIN